MCAVLVSHEAGFGGSFLKLSRGQAYAPDADDHEVVIKSCELRRTDSWRPRAASIATTAA